MNRTQRIANLEETLAFVQRELAALKTVSKSHVDAHDMEIGPENIFVFYDTETNGLGKTDALRIIQLGAVACNEKCEIITEFNEFCSPGREPISQGATAVNGINPEFAKTHDMFNKVGSRFIEWLDELRAKDDRLFLIAHNGKRFDSRIFYFECARNKLIIPKRVMFTDSLDFYKELYPGLSNYKLGTIFATAFPREDFKDQHTALVDAAAMARVCREHNWKLVRDKIIKYAGSLDNLAKRCVKNNK